MAITRVASRSSLLASIGATLLFGCYTAAIPEEDPVPAPPLRIVGEEEIKTKMGQLARHMVLVDEIIQVSDPIDAADRDQLWRELDSMLRLVQSFGRGALDPRHEQFGWRLGALRDNIQIARTAIYASPPEYDLVRTVSSSCTYCHAARRHALNPTNVLPSRRLYTLAYPEP